MNSTPELLQIQTNMLSILCKPVPIYLHRSFTTAHSTSTFRTNFFIQVSGNQQPFNNGVRGYGQCGLPPKKPGCYLSDIEDCAAFIKEIRSKIEGMSATQDPVKWEEVLPEPFFPSLKSGKSQANEVLSAIEPIFRAIGFMNKESDRAPKSALQFAIFDWVARQLKVSFRELVYGEINSTIQTFSFYTVSYEPNVQSMVEHAKNALSFTRFLKFKFSNNMQQLAQLLKSIHELKLGDRIIIDANASWSPADCETFFTILSSLEGAAERVLYLEQPFDFLISEQPQWQQIKNKSPVQILADESCRNEHDFQTLQKVSHAVNIKTQKTGGLCSSLRAAAKAKQMGIEMMFGTMVSTNLGCTQTFQLSPFAAYLDIDGSLLVKSPQPPGGVVWGTGGRVEASHLDFGLSVDGSCLFD